MSQYDEVMTPDPREAKLPAWAQQQLTNLRRVAQTLRVDLDRALDASGPEDSDVVINPYGNIRLGTGPQGLGERPDVRMFLKGVDKGRAYLDARVEDERRQWIRVTGSDRLIILSESSNVVRISTTVRELVLPS